MKSTDRYQAKQINKNDLHELADKLKLQSATTIFKKLGIRHYTRHGSSYAAPGLAVIEGLPKNAPLRVIDEGYWYSAEEIVDIWKEWATKAELERVTR